MDIPIITSEEVSTCAAEELVRYERVTGQKIYPPVPVEDILRSRGLQVGTIDFKEKFGLNGVLAGIWPDKKVVCVDVSLETEKMQARRSFSLAHELAHYRLHRNCVSVARRTVFEGKEKTAIFCRTKDAGLTIEQQADAFAAALIAPEELVRQTFQWVMGKPLEIINVESCYSGPICFDPCVDNWPLIAERIIRAGNFFNVSKQAMIIRLQDLGLVINRTSEKLDWSRKRKFQRA